MSSSSRGPVPIPASGQAQGSPDLVQSILDALSEKSRPLATEKDFSEISEPEIKAAMDRLASREMITYEPHARELAFLTEEAKGMCEDGSHEYRVWEAVKRKGALKIKDLKVRMCYLRLTLGVMPPLGTFRDCADCLNNRGR